MGQAGCLGGSIGGPSSWGWGGGFPIFGGLGVGFLRHVRVGGGGQEEDVEEREECPKEEEEEEGNEDSEEGYPRFRQRAYLPSNL